MNEALQEMNTLPAINNDLLKGNNNNVPYSLGNELVKITNLLILNRKKIKDEGSNFQAQ